jgi:hypothetical protein
MAKSEFRRGLSSASIEKVDSFLKTDVGKHFKEEERFQICIRDEYINIYYHGCSILKYEPKNNAYSIHAKYLGISTENTYIKLTHQGNDLVLDNISLNEIAKTPDKFLGKYIRGEKCHLSEYLSVISPLLLDLEVAFTRERPVVSGSNERKYVADRIDLAVMSPDLILNLIEVKIDTDGRLRSEIDGMQKVLTQMGYYQDFINLEGPAIISSYKQIAQNYIDLDLSRKVGTTNAVLSEFIKYGSLASDPKLLIIETGKSRIGKNQINHWERLLAQFKLKKYLPPKTWIHTA